MKINNIEQAKAFIDDLADKGHLYHFDDDPKDCLSGLVSKEIATEYGAKIQSIYEMQFNWGNFVCPIGYALTKLND